MGWGGDRRSKAYKAQTGTGEKHKASASKPAEAKAPARPPLLSAESIIALQQAMERMGAQSRRRPRTDAWNPYIIHPDRFGPVQDHIKKHEPSLAMDSNTSLMSQNQLAVQAWQAGGLMGNAASEGMLFLGYPYLSELAQRPEFRLICEIRAEEMTRKFTAFRGVADESTKESKKPKKPNRDDIAAASRRTKSGEKPRSDGRNKEIEQKIRELNDYCEELRTRMWFKDAFAQDGFMGISHLYLDIKGVNVENPRDPELSMDIGNGRDDMTSAKFKGKTGFLQGLRTIEAIWCYPTVYNAINPLVKTWYDPQVWYVMGSQVHKSRLLPMIGRPVPDILRPAYAFGGLSLSQMAQPYVEIWLNNRESAAELLHAFSMMILSTNLATTTQPGGSGGMNGDVAARMWLANYVRDNMGMMVIDKNSEDFKNVSAPLSGVADLVAQAQEHCASVARLPLVKYTGIQPKGLNATSEGELRAFEETVAGQQEHFRPQITTVYDLMQMSLWGERDPDITYDFVELRETTPKERAEINKMKAETSQVLIDSGQLWQEEGRQALADDPDSGYDGIEVDDVPDLLEEEETGLIPEGAGRGIEAELEEAEGRPVGGEDGGVTPNFDDMPSQEQARRDAIVTGGGGLDSGKKRK